MDDATTLPPRRRLIGILLGAEEPVAVATLAAVLDVSDASVLEQLREASMLLRAEGTGLCLVERRAGWELATDPAIADEVRRLRQIRPPRPLSDYAKETLFVIMRKGPTTKRVIEEIRHVDDVSPVLRTLRKEGLVVKAGLLEAPGRPALYRATPQAFTRFPHLDALVAAIIRTRSDPPQ